MRIRRLFSIVSFAQTLARRHHTGRRNPVREFSSVLFEDPYPKSSAGLPWSFFCSFLLLVLGLLCRIFVPSVTRSVSGDLQSEKDGVMGLGAAQHSRRSKQSAKSSSTVLCDSSVSLEDWKQKIKVKDSIPANQQRLKFTSQRLIKQPLAFSNNPSNQQWQILVDSSVEDLSRDLSRWSAVLHSKTTSVELLSPLVLTESDRTSFNLHSKAAEELRQIGVSCNVFFLVFNKWIPKLETRTSVDSLQSREPLELDFQIDEKFEEDTYLFDLCGDVSGLSLSIPSSYVMSGKEVALKLLMIEQTAQYREQQKKRYQELSFSVSKEIPTVTQNFLDVNCWSSYHILPFLKNCEYAVCISKETRQLRCFVFPVITIPLYGTKSMEEQAILQTLTCGSKNMARESSSGILALPSTSKNDCESSGVVRSASQKAPASTMDVPVNKSSKKKKKKKSKKSGKHGAKDIIMPGNEHVDVPIESEATAKKLTLSKKSTVRSNRGMKKALDTTRPRPEVSSAMTMVQPKADNGIGYDTNDLEKSSAVSGNTVLENPVLSGIIATNYVGSHLSSGGQEQVEIKEGCLSSDREDTSKLNKSVETQNNSLNGIAEGAWVVKKIEGNGSSTNHISMEDVLDQIDRCHIEEVKPGFDCTNNELKKTKEISETINKYVQPTKESSEHATSSSRAQIERREHFSRSRPNRDGSWTQKASEGHDYTLRDYRLNQNSLNGVTPWGSTPFWRHQRTGSHSTSQNWSHQRNDSHRTDVWPVTRGPVPSSRPNRNAPAWEELPDIKKPNGVTRGYNNHWDSVVEVDESFRQGIKYSSFNMQRKNLGRNNGLPNQYPKSWVTESKPVNCASPGLDVNVSDQPLPVFKNTNMNSSPGVDHVRNSGDLFVNKDGSKDDICKVSSLTEGSAHGSLSNSKGACDTVVANVICDVQPSNIQIIDHICNVMNAVYASCQSRAVYEKISRFTGNPLCQFEKLAKAVSPVLTKTFENHPGCSCMNEVAECGRSVYLQQVSNVPLSTLWQWYEEPSCFGLEVKLTESKNSNAKKLAGNQFQAFFVPYLSAVQLFGWSKKTDLPNDIGSFKEFNSSDDGFLNPSMFSTLLPQNKDDNDNNAQTYQPFSKQTGVESSSEIGDFGSISARLRQCSYGVELLYEFFEGERPQYRQPLTERIKQLVMGQVPPESFSSGDAHLLQTANMGQLHPSSWFAVSWYPIYRIPDGAFRSAFLTYHSLSSLHSGVLASTSTRLNSENSLVTLPVVGLMSYNAQAKDWFALNSTYDSETVVTNAKPFEVLQDHLAKLDAAAASMAKGCGDKSSRYKHLDYEFFQSRGR